jgi:hypothetical protein
LVQAEEGLAMRPIFEAAVVLQQVAARMKITWQGFWHAVPGYELARRPSVESRFDLEHPNQNEMRC